MATPTRLGPDFRRLWAATVVSELGTAISAGALPLIAILVLDVSDFRVSVLAALSGLVSAALAVPLGASIEFRRKRPVMISADLARCLALLSVPVAAAFGGLSFGQLCLVAVVETLGAIVFTAAGSAHLKALVPASSLPAANARLESTFWVSASVGPPLGGLLIGWLVPTVTVVVNALSFLVSAIGIRRLRSPEPAPPERAAGTAWFVTLTGGWRYLLARPDLRALFWNAMLFGGLVMLASPLRAVLMLRELRLPAWQYGLALGVSCLGGVLGAAVTGQLVTRLGQRRVLLTFGVLRTVWLGALALAPVGPAGLIVILAADFCLLFCAGVFNPTFVSYRMAATADDHMSRVQTAWSVSARTVQPVFILAGGALAALTDVRTTLVIAAVLLLASGVLLPWRPGVVTGHGSGPDRGSPAEGRAGTDSCDVDDPPRTLLAGRGGSTPGRRNDRC
ncbi:MFS transporter [Longispora fulva]|uniref:MFS family permease n=1 Tax=Longispora fulva TaxID=619741 RepID=A0A8J7GHR4_9ACTN|nr:MFS transporter [Longispora fulva]MBG6136538.1 MFS family permease [Longispora fulva]GIG59709.1 MFS transporter [Longispora fulva]